jgi:CRP-like cAMP-binding protein
VIHIFAKGESLSEAWALVGQLHLATAEAASAARLVSIPTEHVEACIRSAPDLALAMIALATQHVGQLMKQLAQLKTQTGLQRVADYLASLCPARSGRCVISLPYDKGLIAARLGLTPESLSRFLAKLKSIGVEVHASDLIVRDIGKLFHLGRGDRRRKRGRKAHLPQRCDPPPDML